MVEYGRKFISSIRDKRGENSASQLNALSGLNVLSRRMIYIQDSDTQSISETSPIRKIPVGTKLARSIGGAVVARINVLVRLNQLLDQLTSGHKAAETAKESLRDGSDMNVKNKCNKTAICAAAEKGCLDAATTLLATKADIDIRDQDNHTVLHLAAKAGNADLVRTLVDSKADVNAINKLGLTPFDFATDVESKYALKKLGAGGWTALMVAAEQGDDRVEQYFYLRDCVQSMAPIWTWARHCKDIVVSDDMKSVSKDIGSGYSFVLGSDDFSGEGILLWEILISSFGNTIWAGVISGIESSDRLNSSPKECECELLAAFCSNGDFTSKGGVSISNCLDGASDWLTNALVFKLDKPRGKLELNIGGRTAFEASNLGNKPIRPFICFDGCGMATLISSALQIKKLPSSFKDDVRFYSSLVEKETLWGWGALSHDEIARYDMKITKSASDNRFACAVGSEVFAKGVHSWTFLVDRQKSRVWVGLVRGALEPDNLLCSPDQLQADFVIGFGSDGQCKCYKGRSPIIKTMSASGSGEWSAYQEVTLKLNMHKHTLEIYTNEKLICTASELDDRALNPFVCIENAGSVTLEWRESLVVNSNASMISFKDRAVGLDNALWCDSELNDALLALPTAGDHFLCFYVMLV